LLIRLCNLSSNRLIDAMATAKHGLFSFGNWGFNITESHILKSDGPDREA